MRVDPRNGAAAWRQQGGPPRPFASLHPAALGVPLPRTVADRYDIHSLDDINQDEDKEGLMESKR